MIRNLLFVAIGGAAGSVLRYLTSLAAARWVIGSFPIGTFCANIIGCLLIGILISLSEKSFPGAGFRLLLITGFCGGYTTFSAFSAENLILYRNGEYPVLALYLVASILLGILAVWAGTVAMK